VLESCLTPPTLSETRCYNSGPMPLQPCARCIGCGVYSWGGTVPAAMVDQAKLKPHYRLLLETTFSINTGFALISLVLCTIPSTAIPFAHLEVRLNRLLGIRQTDFIRGYFEVWIPSLALALRAWSLLRLFRRTGLTSVVLQLSCGIAALLCLPVIWTCAYLRQTWSLQWPYRMILGEPALALTCPSIFLNAPWKIARWVGVSAFLTHSVLWCWFMGDGFHFEWGIPGYAGPAGLIVGSGLLFAWRLYIRELRRPKLEHMAAVHDCCQQAFTLTTLLAIPTALFHDLY
jgi:hypothetical protein